MPTLLLLGALAVLLGVLLSRRRGAGTTAAGGAGRKLLLLVLLTAGALGFLVLLYRSRGAILALLPLALPFLQRWLRARAASQAPDTNTASAAGAQARSSIDTRFLAMTLDHASGDLQGRVTDGRFEGRELRALDETDLQTLWRECAADPQSLAVLETYLERRLPDWRERFGVAAGPDGAFGDGFDGGFDHDHAGFDDTGDGGFSSRAGSRAGPDRLGLDEAYAVLGLQPGADSAQVRQAHRRLMQRLHPDHGGSDYLAARINAAKQVLLDALADSASAHR